MTDPKNDSSNPSIKQIGTRPRGLLPQNIQTYFIVGTSALMVGVIGLTGRSTKTTRPDNSAVTTQPDPSAATIEDYRSQIERERKRLAEEKTRLDQTKATFSGGSLPVGAEPTRSLDLRATTSAPPSERNWLRAEDDKREREAPFASNIARSYRDEKTEPRPQTLATETLAETSKSSIASTVEKVPSYRLNEGTMFDTVLTNRIDGTFSAPVNCMVTNDVYASDGRTLVVPAGSRVLGEAQKIDAVGQRRLAVSFHRIILPNGSSVMLDAFKGLNQVGETGLKDQVNNHYLQIFGASLAIGAIAGLGQSTIQYGRDANGTDIYVQGATASLGQSSMRILDRFLNVLPTVTIKEGHRVKVYLTNDLLLPAYEKRPVSRTLEGL